MGVNPKAKSLIAIYRLQHTALTPGLNTETKVAASPRGGARIWRICRAMSDETPRCRYTVLIPYTVTSRPRYQLSPYMLSPICPVVTCGGRGGGGGGEGGSRAGGDVTLGPAMPCDLRGSDSETEFGHADAPAATAPTSSRRSSHVGGERSVRSYKETKLSDTISLSFSHGPLANHRRAVCRKACPPPSPAVESGS